ncbi:hypothetical protein BS47DRAFT_1324205 [Hydnum rufescens UP504]|uniref:RCC1/BLIP-II n=1 Tax=Hydnum rufescens UP504 TaxID=1448309 RepID=A0A9P6BBR6_9AGAM|nr:hypothetical protein BS47DRAFT_1324205 [Hydnum rufescens UP504]
MFRLAGRALPRRWPGGTRTTLVLVAGGALVSASLLPDYVHNDAKPAWGGETERPGPPGLQPRADISPEETVQELKAYAWGSNSYKLLGESGTEVWRFPTPASRLSGVALRDVALHETHAVAVDAAGDVYQWGSQLGDAPSCTLKGKAIVRVAISPSNVFALSASGKIYDLSASQPVTLELEESWLSRWTPTFLGGGNSKNELRADGGLTRAEKFISVSAGRDHLLAVTSKGRVFVHPITLNANSHGQLGTRKIRVLDSDPTLSKPSAVQVELVPKIQQDPVANWTRSSRPSDSGDITPPPENRPLAKLLYEIPALKGIGIAQAVANDRSSYALTKENGGVLTWGANEFGQLGLGSTTTLSCVFVPTEIPLSRAFPSGTSVRCTDVAAGGDIAYFTTESVTDPHSTPVIDIFACGMGQYGALGNGLHSQAQGTPVKVKNISGNMTFNEMRGALEAIRPQSFSVSPTGHALLSLSSGRNLLTWGQNSTYQLGNGKRSSIAQPSYVRDFSPVSGAEDDNQGRMALREGRLKVLRDMGGRVYGRNVKVQEWPVAGWNSSVVYWRAHPAT